MRRTLVAFNAHPDDEALLEAGTLAKAAAAGHRVVLVVATDGALGLTSAQFREGTRDGTEPVATAYDVPAYDVPAFDVRKQEAAAAHDVPALAQRRLAELAASAAALGAERVVHLGYADSGMAGELYPDPPGRTRFLRADPAQAAARLADLLREERADVLLGYDAHGGYGHRDHVRVHEVARRAALSAGTPRLLEATIPRDLIARTVELVAKVYRFPPEFDPTSFRRSFSAASEITHRIDVRRYASAKRAAMAAHASQAAADDDADRTLAAFLRLPAPVFALAFGREWYVDATGLAPGDEAPGRPAGRLGHDVFAGL